MSISAWLWSVCGLLLVLSACGAPMREVPPELAGRQPSVTKVIPLQEATLGEDAEIQLTFSRPLEPATVHEANVMLIDGLAPEITLGELIEAWEDGEVQSVPMTLVLTDDGMGLTLQPDGLLMGPRAAVFVSVGVLSAEGLPLTQSPGEGSRPFAQFYTVSASGAGMPADVVSGVSAPPSSGVGAGSDDMGGTSSTGGASVLAAPLVAPPVDLVINELLYDVAGTDTNGVLFVELRGTPGGHVAGYVIRFMNGDGGKETEHVLLPEGMVMPEDGFFVVADGITGNLEATHVVNADFVDNFDPQNGPEGVQLLSPDGAIVDVLGYGMPLPLHDAEGLPMYEGTPAEDAPEGSSLSRLAGGLDTNINNEDFVINSTPSPGLDAVSMQN